MANMSRFLYGEAEIIYGRNQQTTYDITLGIIASGRGRVNNDMLLGCLIITTHDSLFTTNDCLAATNDCLLRFGALGGGAAGPDALCR